MREPYQSARIWQAKEIRCILRIAKDGKIRDDDREIEIRPTMRFSFQPATTDDAAALVALHNSVAEDLTQKHGIGAWSGMTSEKGLLYALRNSNVFVARAGTEIIATLRLATKQPWAIDVNYFSPARKPLYLLAMAVIPQMQRQGIGKRCLEEAAILAKARPADAIRLDAYDAKAGAGRFYTRCGYTEVGRASYRNTPLIYFELHLE